MNQETSAHIKTGDYPIVDEWAKLLPNNAFQTITTYIPDYKKVVKIRRSTGKPQISTLEDSFQLVINYNCYRDCFIVWNAAIQHHIYRKNNKNGKGKLRLSLGSVGERLLHQQITTNFQKCYYREFGRGGSNHVELIWILGRDAFVDFCKDYPQMIIPDPTMIPKGKSCLYAVAGEEIQYIKSKKGK